MSRTCPGPGVAGGNHLVAHGQDAHPWPLGHFDPLDAQREQRPDILGPDHVASREDRFSHRHILARLSDVLSRSHRAHHLDGVGVDGLGVFHHDHGIGVSGQHAAGVRHRRLADAQVEIGAASHGHLAHQREPGRQSVAGPIGVRRPHAVAVHRGAWKGGKGLSRQNFGGNYPAQGLGSIHHTNFRSRSLRKHIQEQRQRLPRRQDVEKFRHCEWNGNYPRVGCQSKH